MDKNTLSWYELNDMTFEERCVVVRIELEGEKADDEFLIDMVEGIEDKDLLKYVLDNHFEGILSEEVLETIANEYSYYDTDFMKYLLENYHRDVDVSEDFIRAMIDRYDDADFTSYLLKNFYQISATEKETIAKYKEEEIKPDTEENDANKEVDEKDSAVGEETKQAQNLRQSEERTRPLTIYDNAILRFLAYIACGLLMLVRVAKCSSLMVIVGSCEYKLIDFLKRGSRYTKKPSKLPRYIRQLLIKLGIYAARLLVLGIITLTYSIMVIYIIVFALILQVIDLILSNYAEGQFGNYLDEIIWAVLLDAWLIISDVTIQFWKAAIIKPVYAAIWIGFTEQGEDMTQQKPHSKILNMLLQSIAVIALLIMKALKWYFVAIYAIYDKIKIIATIFLTLTLICSLIAPGEYNVRFIILLLIGIHAVGIPAVLLFGLIESIINKLNAYLGLSAEDYTLEDIDDDSYDDTEDDLTIDEMIFMDMMDEDD